MISMSESAELGTRIGRRIKPFIGRVLASAQKAGGLSAGRRSARSTFGCGRSAAFLASRSLTSRSRGVVVNARVVRHQAGAAPLVTHLRYLRRGVSKEGEPARMFDEGVRKNV
jgi:hypothetical protein